MNVNKRDKLKLPKKKKPDVPLKASEEIYLPTYHFLLNEFHHARLHEKGIIRDDDIEFLHQYRVSLRRCRVLISLMKTLFLPRQKKMLNLALKTLMQKTNQLRDLDVFLEQMDDYFSKLDHRHHQGLSCFFDALQHEREATHKAVKKWLKTDNYEQQCQQVKGLIKELEATPVNKGRQKSKAFAQGIIWKRFQRTVTICSSLDSNSPDEQIHQLRICCKKLRYLLEYFTPLFPTKTTKVQIRHLKQLQDELGDFNDSSTQLIFFESYLERHEVPSLNRRAIAELKKVTRQNHLASKERVIQKLSSFISQDNVASFKALYHCEC
ncbi:CHAD domain-containing protein [Photobacterium atrarenae]|uniref:CHAD domain-containing protein n=1 Tax=Photobacterium atrarenae TaxID=865757 RepID=A0ABY5GMB3_9GAMM|nr:CHAD domain-containing protein [Photobacterium atrarenae]UTV30392.1 CHAD domain-containing protein [Photobacterium atrarenae]